MFFFREQKGWRYLDNARNVMLECSKRAENTINRKVTIFYIETVLNFFFQLRKIIFLRSIEKKCAQKVNFFENPLGFKNFPL